MPARREEVERRRALFRDSYASSGNATQAAKDAGYKGNGIRNRAEVILRDPEFKRSCEEARQRFVAESLDTHKRQREELVRLADDAIRSLGEVARGEVARGAVARVSAAIAILDRAGHKPVERLDHSSSDGSMTPRTLDSETLAQRVQQLLRGAAKPS